MNLIITLVRDGQTDTAQVIGREADEGEQLTCDGCGELSKRLYDDNPGCAPVRLYCALLNQDAVKDDMNMLCAACIALLVGKCA